MVAPVAFTREPYMLASAHAKSAVGLLVARAGLGPPSPGAACRTAPCVEWLPASVVIVGYLDLAGITPPGALAAVRCEG
jgi:hypothetical protein